jgi:hypothetical protein
MPASRIPGPLGTDTIHPTMDQGTLALIRTEPPTAVGLTPPVLGPGTATTVDAAIEALDLAPSARAAAYALKSEHPGVSFTSGRRDKGDQARAMAGNVVKNRQWITETYVASDLRKSLQKWLDDNPKAVKKDEIEAGLLAVFNAATPEAVGKFSKHLSGEAFDVLPVTDDTSQADAIKKTIRSLSGLDKFLETEGGLVRWHVQF